MSMRRARIPAVIVRMPHGDRMMHLLLGALATTIFVTEPLASMELIPQNLQSVFVTLVVAMGFLGLEKPTKLARPLLALSVLVVVTRAAALATPSGAVIVGSVLISVLCLVVLGAALLREVFTARTITIARIEGAVAVYLLMATAFAGLYSVIEFIDAHAFTGSRPGNTEAFRSQFLYFSLVAQTSTGFGDIAPVNPIARALVTLQAVMGQLFTTVLLARLVSLELSHREKRKGE